MAAPVEWKPPVLVVILLSKEFLLFFLFSMFLCETTLPLYRYYRDNPARTSTPYKQGMLPPNRPLDPELYDLNPARQYHTSTLTRHKLASLRKNSVSKIEKIVDDIDKVNSVRENEIDAKVRRNKAASPDPPSGKSKITALERIARVLSRKKHANRPRKKRSISSADRLPGGAAIKMVRKYEMGRDKRIPDVMTSLEGEDKPPAINTRVKTSTQTNG